MLTRETKELKTVAIVLNTSWNIYNFRLPLIRELVKIGYEVILIAPRDEYTKKLEEEGFKYYDIKIDNKGTNPFVDSQLIYNFYKLYREIKPDLILNYTIKPNIYSSLASKLLSIPTINNITGLGTVFLNNKISSKIAHWLYRIALYNNSVVFQNRDDMRLFIDKKIVKERDVELILGSGIDVNHFKSKNSISKNEKFTFLMIARLIKDKGINEYIDAIRVIRASEYAERCTFKLLGSLYLSNPTAISEKELNSWIDEGIIEYLGHSDSVEEEIDKVDAIVLPSYREGLSRVLLEASSMSKPIITTNVAGCRDVVDDGINGYLVEVKNSLELAEAMKKMVDLPIAELRYMGKNGRKKVVDNFSEERVVRKQILLINKNFLGYKKIYSNYKEQYVIKEEYSIISK